MTQPPRDPETAAWKRAYRDLQGAGSESCPPSESLAALALNELPPNERDRVADHSIACRRCASDLKVIMQTDAEAGGTGRRQPIRMAILAAAVALVGVAGVLLTRRPPEAPEVLRGMLPASAQVTPAGGAELETPPTELAWPPQDRADGYRARLYSATGELLWQSDRVTAPRTGLPSDLSARLSPGSSYYWTVEVEGPSGKTRIGPFPFAIRRP